MKPANLHRIVKRTQVEMVRDRGFEIPPAEAFFLEDPTLDEFKNYLVEKETSSDGKSTDAKNNLIGDLLSETYVSGNRRLGVYYLIPQAAGDSISPTAIFVSAVLNLARSAKMTEVILISVKQLSSTSKKLFNTEFHVFDVLQSFTYDELCYNVTKYHLTPPHTLLRGEELEKNFPGNLREMIPHLPVMSKDDPVARYYAAVRGDVFKIDRFLPGIPMMASSTLAYRRVDDVGAVFSATMKKKK